VENVYAEWIAACKGGPAAGSSFAEYAAPFTEMVLLGCLAVRVGRTLELDPETGRILGPAVPAEYVRPAYRAGWEF
jgi:hypothetical protein